MTEYDEQAADFLKKTGATITARYITTGKHFDDDDENRDIYEITISRGSRSYVFKYGDSIANTEKRISDVVNDEHPSRFRNMTAEQIKGKYRLRAQLKELSEVKLAGATYRPTAYDVLACMQAYEPEQDIQDFADAYGYTKIKPTIRAHKAVLKEYAELQKLFTDAEMELLQEIQ